MGSSGYKIDRSLSCSHGAYSVFLIMAKRVAKSAQYGIPYLFKTEKE